MMRPRTGIPAFLALLLLAGCSRRERPDAFGNFEAVEVVVTAEASGQLLAMSAAEGATLDAGAVAAVIDTTALGLERAQLLAQREATRSRSTEVARQAQVLAVQRDVARTEFERARRLYADSAATAQQVERAERDWRVLDAQIDAAGAQRATVARELAALDARVSQLDDRLRRSRVRNPVRGTVLATYAERGEIVQAGQPLYRIASLDTLILRAYVAETQLASVRIGQPVRVTVDAGDSRRTLPGSVSWISSEAEFTPTPIQTRDERASLVYAVKIRVPNADGAVKIGMPADVALGSVP